MMMTITEIIEQLEEIKKEYGDIKIYIENEDDRLSIQGITVEEEYIDKVKYALIY